MNKSAGYRMGHARLHCVLLGLCLAAVPGAPVFAQGKLPARYELADLKLLEESFVGLAENVRESVVAIRTYFVPDPDQIKGRRVRIPVSQGSGFIVDSGGYIVTNQHVLAEANSFTVILDNGLQYEAEEVATDSRIDLAMLKIDAEGLKAADLGDLSGVKIGQWTFAVGNPFGLANDTGRMSVTFGTVSQLGRDMTRRLVGNSDERYYGNLIESSSAINPGNSGGPLFNIKGEVIGIIVAIETSSGISEGVGFAIPMDRNVRRVLDILKEGEPVQYGYMGVEVVPTAPQAANAMVRPSQIYAGAAVRAVVPGGPAAQAGLREEDVIVEVNGMPVEDPDHLVRLVQYSPVGSEVAVTYLRRNVRRSATIVLADREEMVIARRRTSED